MAAATNLQTLQALSTELTANAARYADSDLFPAIIEDIISHAAKVACLVDGVRLSPSNISERRSELWSYATSERQIALLAL